MTGDGGFIALSLDDCDALLWWYEVANDGGFVLEEFDIALRDRLREWRARHSSEDIPG